MSSIDSQNGTDEATGTAINPDEDSLNSDEEEGQSEEYIDFGSNTYWKEAIKNQKDEIDEIVHWFQGIEYCKALSFYGGNIGGILPDNKQTREKIRAEKDFEKMKEIISQNEFDIRNNWFEDKRIIILHGFDMEEISGNYCLVYVGSKLKKSEDHYKKVADNYYSEVIFYE